ncbi:MAG: hypothetical protein LBI12_00705 [Treponema sp.]|jgi:hypothetical protein|nr:hypothetical protein [Treponema sp.]
MSKLTDFARGIIAGVLLSVFIFGVIFLFRFLNKSDKELIEYAEKIQAIEQSREDYSNTDAIEFIDTIPDVRRAADGAADEFIRKRDKALQRFRSRHID